MRIGIDADGVLTDMTAFNIEYGERYFKRPPKDPTGYSAETIFGCTTKEEFRFGLRYFLTYCKKWPPRVNCSSIIAKLNADGHELYEITARKFVTSKHPLGWYVRRIFKKWLKKHGLNFKGIFYCSESNSPSDKLDGCRRFEVDVMIDDKPEVVYFLAKQGIRVLLFDAPYNQEVSGGNIIRVMNWEDVYKEIEKIKEKSL